MYVSLVLVFFSVVACVAPTYFIKRSHDIQDGLVNWKCTVNGIVEQETKYGYNEDGEIVSIKFFAKGKPVFFSSEFEYITVEDTSGMELTYRCLSKRAYYLTSTGTKQWEETITVEIVDNVPKIKSIVTKDGSGVLKYKDEYDYDEMGRKTMAKRTEKNGNSKEYEFTYEEGMVPGIVPTEYFFELPIAFYDGNHYISWCTLASQEIPVNEIKWRVTP